MGRPPVHPTDILQITPKQKIIVEVDYFTRFIFAKMVTTNESRKVVYFLEDVNEQFPIKTLLSDNGREFKNEDVEEWAKERNINHLFAIPYYHQSNGRVERANRTIRNGIRKAEGSVKRNLNKVVANYNEMYHRGIGMSPKEVLDKNNWDKVRGNSVKYQIEFERLNKKVETIDVRDVVILKNEIRKNKMQNYFDKKATVIREIYGDIYELETPDRKIIRRHASQMKKVKEGEVGIPSLVSRSKIPKGEVSLIGSLPPFKTINNEENK